MSKTARQRYDEMKPIKGADPYSKWTERMRLYQQILGDESYGMTTFQWFTYLALPWDEKLAYSEQVKNKKQE